MRNLGIQHVTIVGVGLLGGSAGLAIKKLDRRVRIAGVGRREESLRAARKAGAIDTMHLDAAQAVGESDLVILATPVGAFEHYLRAIRPCLKRGAVVTDVGSTKQQVVRIAESVFRSPAGTCPFVGSHPMAGSENKGVGFSRADLYRGATCIVTPTRRTAPRAQARVTKFWKALGMQVVTRTPADHDAAVAQISHLPHALACLLMLLPQKQALPLAATGFADMTRLAGGDFEMWRDIFLTNRDRLLAAIDDFDESLMCLRDLVELGDAKGIETFLLAAKHRHDAK